MTVDYDRVGEVYEDGEDESLNDQILEMIVSRMNVGAKKYGEHIMLSDSRNFVEEALEEALDMVVYICVSLLKLSKNNRGK